MSLAARYFEGLGSGSSIHRSGELSVIKRIARSGAPQTYLDVGANVGDYTAEILAAAPRARVHAFDASPFAAKQLTERFAGAPGVAVNAIGLSDRVETRTLLSRSAGNGEASFYEHLGETIEHTSTVECTTLDAYCAQQSITAVGLLKVDVEGHELAVLRGATGLLRAKAIHAVQFDGGAAFNSRVFFRDYWTLFTEHGYKVFRVLPFGLVRIPTYRERDECCLPTIYLAERE